MFLLLLIHRSPNADRLLRHKRSSVIGLVRCQIVQRVIDFVFPL